MIARLAGRRLRPWWDGLFRIFVGSFWLYFAAQKWQSLDWVRPLLEASARTNPVPGLHQLLELLVLPNWHFFTILQTIGETLVGIFLILGIASRAAAAAGVLLALDLALTIGLLEMDANARWLYWFALATSSAVLVAGAGRPAVQNSRIAPRWLRS